VHDDLALSNYVFAPEEERGAVAQSFAMRA
jgi:hypothetical protein